jgi:hypothetical protein
MRLFDRIEVKHLNKVCLFMYLEDDGEGSPDVHTINLCWFVKTFHVRCSVRVF